MHAEVTGPVAGRQILLLHGWGSSASMMRTIAQSLENSCRVHAVDLPGHGPTPPPDRPLDIPGHVRLVADYIETAMTAPVTIVGHSNGGRIALSMASDDRYQSLIERLVLISPSGVKPVASPKVRLKRTVARAAKALFAILPPRLQNSGLDWLRGTLLWRSLGSSDYRALSGVMRDTFVRVVNHHLEPEMLSRISVPTLIFRGDRDTAVGKAEVDVMVKAIPDSGLVVLENAGHYGYADRPDIFTAALRHFLIDSEKLQ